jgi:predicted ferric reductase
MWIVTGVLLVAVLIGARTSPGTAAVAWLRGFLEFYSGVFALLAMTATVVAGVIAAQHAVPARFRILVQAAHRATALMTVGFLVAHILLKVMEAHAGVLDILVPFLGGQDRARWVGLGTIASDLLILAMATGVMRGRFVGNRRPWLWRSLHGLAYAMWPLGIAHGLLAGRSPTWWVTASYLVCFAFVAVAALARLPRIVGNRNMIGAHRPAPRADPPQVEVPDEQFWRLLRAEAKQWIGDRR